MERIKRANWMICMAVVGLIALVGTSSGCDEDFYFDGYGAYAGYSYDGYDYVTQGLGYTGFDDWAGNSISTFAGSFVSYD